MPVVCTEREVAITADRKERLTSLAGVALLHLVLGWALLLSLAPALVKTVSEPLGVFNVRPVPPPPPEVPPPPPKIERNPAPRPAPREPEGASAPPAPRSPVKTVAASRRVIDRDLPPPVAAGLVPFGPGSSGGSDSDGNGSGSGGSGSGTGSGTAGNGSGGGGTGGSGRVVVRAKQRGGSILPRDYPRAANGKQGVVETRLTVSPTGAVVACTVTRSSGSDVLDATTCRLIRQRFRFTPARDAQGNAVTDVRGWQQRWWQD
jgi:protein TonB